MKEIECGGIIFNSKSALVKTCQMIVSNNDIGEHLTGSDYSIMLGVIGMHYRYENEDISGADIRVDRCWLDPKNKTLTIIHKGEEDNISYRKAISKPSHESCVREGFRYAVYPDTSRWKKNYFKSNQDNKKYVKCAVTGLKIKVNEAHLDHHPLSFKEIVDNYMEDRGLSFSSLQVKSFNKVKNVISDDEIAKDFREYHRSVCQWRIVFNKANLQNMGK